MIAKNNPFNLPYILGNYWIGQTGVKDGFCVFSRLEYGVRAACVLISRNYRKNGVLSVSEIIKSFGDDDVYDDYLQFVCSYCSVFPFDVPTRSEFSLLLHALSVYEGNRVSVEFIDKVFEDFKIVPYKCS